MKLLRRAAMPQRMAGSPKSRMMIALLIVGISLFSYFSQSSQNPITGEKQQVALSIDQEIALGLQSAPQMAEQHGGLSDDQAAQNRVDAIGKKLLRAGFSGGTPYRFEFHLLKDPKTVNAFALPGGQVFITEALYRQLTTDGQVAGVLGHEIGHVIERHGSEHLAKQQLTQGLVGAAGIATYDPENPSSRAAGQIAAAVGQLLNMKYGRDDELESDRWGVRLLSSAGYDPRELIRVMEVLEEATKNGRPPEFFSTHPNPENRVATIEAEIGRTTSRARQ